jgi:NAD(P)-dependent dehydrogenase (short-subunit alcohol dehydrogenase family)
MRVGKATVAVPGESSLAGSTALVTGAAKRLGRAIALALSGEGANVVIHYGRSAEAAARTAEEALAAGVKAWTLQADLAEPEEANLLFPRAVDLAGPIDILVNNASIFFPDRLDDLTPRDINRNVQIHAIAPLLLSRAMAAQGRGGHIVNLLDSRITGYDRDHAAYHLSKRMLFTLTRMLALELAPGIAVNAVAPGLILPPPGEDERYLRRMVHTNPLRRHGGPADVVHAALYLLKSTFVTGQVLFVDGGYHMNGSVYG